jgi:hypothetical protein
MLTLLVFFGLLFAGLPIMGAILVSAQTLSPILAKFSQRHAHVHQSRDRFQRHGLLALAGAHAGRVRLADRGTQPSGDADGGSRPDGRAAVHHALAGRGAGAGGRLGGGDPRGLVAVNAVGRVGLVYAASWRSTSFNFHPP